MQTKVEISDQVVNFVRSLAPEPRRSLPLGLQDLEGERGDIKQLEGDLAGWCRLRVKNYRVIFRYKVVEGRRTARCVFAERRELVYELFAEAISNKGSTGTVDFGRLEGVTTPPDWLRRTSAHPDQTVHFRLQRRR